MLSWLPNSLSLSFVSVWTSPYGYNHQEIGRKVSQLQAVLARRCAAVGELQQHLLRAGWHRGVAQWGGTLLFLNEMCASILKTMDATHREIY
jgi:hypothetical protein